ncbi:MAG: hypothetical protein ABI480_10170 [Chitinophagaceae bacterium]
MNTPVTEVVENPKNVIKAMRILCTALMAGCLLFALIVLLLINFGHMAVLSIPSLKPFVFGVAVVCVAIVCLVLGITRYNKSITSAKESLNTMQEKLNAYRPALIIYMATCEGPALFGIIIYFITGNYLALLVTLIMLGAMLAKFPTMSRVITDLGLSSQEQIELE